MILGIDVSHWQSNLGWIKIAKVGVRFMFAKCTDIDSGGKDYFDNKYIRNIEEAGKVGIITGSYHFFEPKYGAEHQANIYFNQTRKAVPNLPPVIDLETSQNLSNNKVKDQVMVFVDKTKKLWGEYPIIYSRDGLVKQFGLDGYVANENLYWKADYNARPMGKKSKFWQYSERFRIPGIACNLDSDYFLGTFEELKSMAGNINIPNPTAPIGKIGKVIVNLLNIRSGPGIQYRVVGQLHKNDQITIFSVQNERWFEIGDGFCAEKGEDGIFVQRLE